MFNISKLIEDLCPDGVEFMPLSDVATIRNGRDYKNLNRGRYPVYGSGGVMTYVDSFVYAKPSVLIPRKGSLSNLFFVDNPFWVVDTIYYTEIDESILVPKFLYYFLAKSKLAEYNQAGGVPSLTQKVLNKINIPVPPLGVQEEIVRILDGFTLLEAELEAELEARRKQYAFYRDSLLNFENRGGECKYLPFGELANISRGASPRPIKNFVVSNGEGFPWIKIGDVPENGKYVTETKEFVSSEGANKSREITEGDFIMSNSMSFGRPYISKIRGYIHDGWLKISEFENYFESDYLYYLLRTDFVQKQFRMGASSGTVSNLNADIVRKVVLPVPNAEEQRKVVAVLDRFDALVNDISSGLPAEIAARRKQYEHYRDQLLTFKELEPVSI